MHVAPLIARFADLHPSLRVTLDLSEKPWVDSKAADVVIHIGVVRDSSWVGHLLARNARWACASTAYLKRRGVPSHPRDLLGHACLCVRENDEDVTLWRYRAGGRTRAAGARAQAVRITPALTSNDGEVVRNWALDGLGITLRSEWDVAPLVKRGALRRILANWEFEGADVLALVPMRQGISVRVARFVDFLKQHFHPRPPWR
jgi:DNA-binding transcriptional LysR family regulator